MAGWGGRRAWCLVAMLCQQAAPSTAQETIIFVSDRDGNREIYSMDLNGRGQTNLTRHPRRDQAPAVSPDRKRVAWLSDRSGRLGIWLMASDGSNQRLLRELPNADFGLIWSPAGDQLAVTLQQSRGGMHDLALVDASTGALVQLTDTRDVEEITPSWGPRGDEIYFVTGSGSTALIRMQFPSGETETIVSGLPSAAFPIVAPDGESVLLRSRTDQFDVLMIDLVTREVRNLTDHPADDWGAAWLTDSRITFASDRDGDMDIYVLDLNSGAVQRLTNNDTRDWMPTR